MRRLSGSDTLMLASDNATTQNLIAPVAVYDASTAPGGRLTLDDVLRHVESRLHVSDTFREKLVRVPLGLGNPYWVKDPDFDLEYHVRHIALPQPGTWEQFAVQVARIGQRPLDLSRPPWELYLIEGLDSIDGVPPGSFAILLKLHHAAVDGVAGVELINALNDHEPVAAGTPLEDGPLPDAWQPDGRPSELGLIGRAVGHAVVDPIGNARHLLWPTLRNAPSGLIRRVNSPDMRAQGLIPTATRFNKPVGPHRVWDCRRFLLEDAKRIKEAVPGATINDVALGWVGGAVRAYLDKHGELPDYPLLTLMPMSLRPTTTQGRAPGTEVEASRGGNRFKMATIVIGSDIADPLERIAMIGTRTRVAKEYALDAPGLVQWSEAVPGALLGTAQRAVTRLAARTGRAMGVHMLVTNVPGPRRPLYFAGAKCLFTTGMAPVVDGMGLINAITSYQETFSLTFTADRDMMPDPLVYAACVDQAFLDMRAAA